MLSQIPPWLRAILVLALVATLIALGILIYQHWQQIVLAIGIAFLLFFFGWFSVVKVRQEPDRRVDGALWTMLLLLGILLWAHKAEQERKKAAKEPPPAATEWNFDPPGR